MSDVNYEEGYFKLKKSNEDLSILINKVLNDFKQTKAQLLSEKDKNNVIVKRNILVEKQLSEITTRYDAQTSELEDLKDEVASLKTYTEAVEGVAENYCGKNMETESKYKKLKRQSTMMFSKFTTEDIMEMNIDSVDVPDSPMSLSTPIGSVPDLSDIRKPLEDKLAKEKCKKLKLRTETQELKDEIEKLKENINSFKAQLEEKSAEKDKLLSEMEILSNAHSVLHEDHEQMMQCFSPFLKMKSENLELKRTSAFLLSDANNDSKLMQLAQMIDEIKKECAMKDLKIKELESNVDSTSLTIEITALKLQLDDLSDKLAVATKERDTLNHENRILREQKGGPGIAAPPPPAPPPPPPPPPANKILNLFKGKHSKHRHTVASEDSSTGETKKLADLMSELQKKLEDKIKNERLKNSRLSPLPSQKTVDVPDSTHKDRFAKLRSQSVPCNSPSPKELNELQKVFNRRKVAQIHEEHDESSNL